MAGSELYPAQLENEGRVLIMSTGRDENRSRQFIRINQI